MILDVLLALLSLASLSVGTVGLLLGLSAHRRLDGVQRAKYPARSSDPMKDVLDRM